VPRLHPGPARARRRLAMAPTQAANDAAKPEQGCAYAPRCAWATARCLGERPLLRTLGGAVVPGHAAACHAAEAVAAQPGGDPAVPAAMPQNA
jgi:dipeptide transport system ATP-binding protein